MNIIESIEELTETYRQKLNYKTWEEKAAELPGMAGRRSGRTTRDMLRVIAVASLTDIKHIVIAGKTTSIFHSNLREIMRMLLQELGIYDAKLYSVKVVAQPRDAGSHVIYQDHYTPL